MQTDKKFFDDLARFASNASGTFFEMKREIDAQVQQRLDGLLAKMNLVTREEFDVLKDRFDVLQARFDQMESAEKLKSSKPKTKKENDGTAADS